MIVGHVKATCCRGRTTNLTTEKQLKVANKRCNVRLLLHGAAAAGPVGLRGSKLKSGLRGAFVIKNPSGISEKFRLARSNGNIKWCCK